MKIKSAEEAIAVLKKTRSPHVEEGRKVAAEIANRAGTVHSRDVWDEMKRTGKINEALELIG